MTAPPTTAHNHSHPPGAGPNPAMPTDDHVHTPGSGSAAVIGWVDDHPIPRDRLDQRLDELRNGPLRSALPVPGTSEDRQLARWVTQVILTEALCEATAADLGLSPEQATERDGCTPARSSPPVGGSEASWRLDRVAAVELGSINAAAYHGSPWARAVFHHVTASASVPPEWRRSTSSGRRLRSSERSPRHLVRHRLFDDPARARDATEADLESLGPVELDSLPTAIAEALNSHPYGTLVGPVVDALGWHVAMATPVHPAPASATLDGNDHDSSLVEAARRKAFARWLDDMRAKRVRLVPGFEHPGDPRQPDNHHKH